MHIDLITVVPGLLEGPFSHSILKRAEEKGIATVRIHNLRDYATGKQKQVDDYQYGGGAGMVMTIEPIARVIVTTGLLLVCCVALLAYGNSCRHYHDQTGYHVWYHIL